MVAGILLFLISREFSLGHQSIYVLIPTVALITTYVSSFGTNLSISATNCPINLSKSALVSLIPAAVALLIGLLFVIVERYFSLFGFVFNRAGITFNFDSNWSTASIFGLVFFVFWGVLYGQLIAGSMAEVC